MENKINIAELLKDCPKGMELDCTMFNDVTFERFDVEQNRCYFKAGSADTFWTTCYGTINGSPFGKCIIFPKGKTTWEGFVPPCQFKDGDIVINASNEDSNAFIYAGEDNDFYNSYVGLTIGTYPILSTDKKHAWVSKKSGIRFATEYEKEKLFDAIKDNGYKWNEETKTLEKLPRFKVGDRIVKRNGISVPVLITRIGGNYYYSNTENSTLVLSIAEQDEYELVLDKFDIYTLVPFESRVLIRNDKYSNWKPAIFGCYMKDKTDSHYSVLGGTCWRYCIPYKGNEHLLGTTNDCDEYYKTW